MRKLLVLVPLFVLAAGCDSTRRDWTYCDQKYNQCAYGYTCDLTQGLCVLAVDGGATDALSKLDGSVPVDLGSDAKDAPIGIDGAVIDSSIVDSSIVDTNQTVDTRVPDAAGTCSVDNDCVGVAAGAYCVSNRCVACKTSSQCSNAAGVPFCSAQNTCVSCASAGTVDGGANPVCSGATPVCNAGSGSCVQCVKASDCPTAAKAFCAQNQCVGCDSVAAGDGGVVDAGATGPSCSGTTPLCMASNAGNAKAGQCVQCRSNSDCSPTPNTPICDVGGTFTCKACTSDSQCAGIGSGVCMFNDGGRCASVAETIYVQNTAGCLSTSTSTSSATTPYCQPQTGLNAVKANRRVIIMSGPSSLMPFSADLGAGSPLVSIVGQNNPSILVGAASSGIELVTGSLYIRGLVIQGAGSGGANGPGIQVDSTASFIGMDRCRVFGNAGGLLVNAGVNFDVGNSVFVGNVSGQVNATTFFGGVYLGGSAPSTGLSQFRFNTIYNNTDRGVICADTSLQLTGLLAYKNIGGDYASCVMDKTSIWGDGKKAPDGTTSIVADVSFDTSNNWYHLADTNKCRDYVDASTPHPFDDIDGERRPKGVKLDCGADEF